MVVVIWDITWRKDFEHGSSDMGDHMGEGF